MKVQLHKRHKAFKMPVLLRARAQMDVAKLYGLLPKGDLPKPLLAVQCGHRDTNEQKLMVSDFKYPGFPTINYDCYTDPLIVAKDRLTIDFLKKYTGFTTDVDPEKAALETFLETEEWCKLTNRRLRSVRDGAKAPYLNTIMLMAQRKIARTLGSFSVNELLNLSYWGPGVTSSVKGSFTDAANKFQARPDVSPDFAVKAAQLMSFLPSWSALLADSDHGCWVTPVLNVISGNSITFVPKTALTHRSIAVEPHINSFFQLGIGKMIRKRLKRVGIDLDDQSTNQKLARLGSIDGSLATIDLTSASDTISKELVRELLPEDWFAWLDMTRSKQGTLNKEKLLYEKFSSMGNGFTFDLESLIFWAVAQSVVEHRNYNPFWVNVMGDDIIVPSGCYVRVVRVLQELGFVVNKSKSFHKGLFRESCGCDCFRGADVRPVYLKKVPQTPMDWLRIANALRRLSSHWLRAFGKNGSLKPAYDFAVSRVPKDFRLLIPDGYGDGGLIVNFDEATPRMAEFGWEGFLFQHLTSKSEKKDFRGRSLVTSGLHKLSQRGNLIALRDRVSYKKVTSIAPVWSDLGQWVN